MAIWDEPEPGEHLIRLLKAILALIAVYLLCPCLGLGFRFHDLLRDFAHLSRRASFALVVVVPALLVVPLAATGFVLARSAPSRLLFVAAGALGVLVAFFLLLFEDTIFF
jgi:hypothetical protein